MTSKLKQNEHFIHLILEAPLKQKNALLHSISPQQVDAITEVIYNLLYVIPLPTTEHKKLHRKKAFKEIAKTNRSIKYRRDRIKKIRNRLLLLYKHIPAN